MASEIRVDKINSLSGVGTVTLSPTGVDIAGITTACNFKTTTGIVTSLTAGSLTSLGAQEPQEHLVVLYQEPQEHLTGAVSGTTGTVSVTRYLLIRYSCWRYKYCNKIPC